MSQNPGLNAHLHLGSSQSYDSHSHPSGMGAGKPQVEDMAVFRRRYMGSSGILEPVMFREEDFIL